MKNEYGLDVSYFNSLIQRMARDIDRYTPDEFARQCLRMSVTADSKVITEPEFRAALAEHGMVAVPLEPTFKMREATDGEFMPPVAVYKAMLAAAEEE